MVRAVLLMSLLAAGCGAVAPAMRPSPAANLSSVAVSPLAGGVPVRLTALQLGRTTVIDLFATWCTPCRDNFPALRELARAYPEDALLVLSVNVGEDAAKVTRFLASFPLSSAVYLDPTFRFADSLGTGQIPLVLVVDRHGKIVHSAAKIDRELLDVIAREVGSRRQGQRTRTP
jgi:thiol-disulfide isomerase/thioredoxin